MADTTLNISEGDTISMQDFRIAIRSLCPSCTICGWKGHSLVYHLMDRHSLSIGQYRKKYGEVAVTSPLVMELMNCMNRSSAKNVNLAHLIPSYKNLLSEEGTTSKKVDRFQEWKKELEGVMTFDTTLSSKVPEVNPHFVFTKVADYVALALLTGKNLFISGQTGSGKSQMVLQTLARLGVPVQRVNMSSDVSYNSFVGNMHLNNEGTYFKYGFLPTAMKEGYPVLLDEIDFTPPNIASVLYPALESRTATLFIPETGELIFPKKGFIVYATGNTKGKGDRFGNYTGTEVLNTAFLDRFSMHVKADYLPQDKEIDLMEEVFGRNSYIEPLVKFANEVREANSVGNLEVTLSTRRLMDIMEFIPVMGIKEALDIGFLNWVDPAEIGFVTNLMDKLMLLDKTGKSN